MSGLLPTGHSQPRGAPAFVTLLANDLRRSRCPEGRLVGEMEGTVIRGNKQQPLAGIGRVDLPETLTSYLTG